MIPERTKAIVMGAVAATFWAIGSVQASTCPAWKLSREETEEGRQLMAHVCSTSDRGNSTIAVTCSGKRLYLRYTPRIDGDFTGQKRVIAFVAEDTAVSMQLTYEAMDGAFAKSKLPPNHPVFSLFAIGRGLTVRDPAGKIPAKAFSLSGARSALAGLLNNCK
jgi:hypothetical protein